jgi:hypothetical protein
VNVRKDVKIGVNVAHFEAQKLLQRMTQAYPEDLSSYKAVRVAKCG